MLALHKKIITAIFYECDRRTNAEKVTENTIQIYSLKRGCICINTGTQLVKNEIEYTSGLLRNILI